MTMTKKAILAGIIVIILAAAVAAQTTGNQSTPATPPKPDAIKDTKTFYDKAKEYEKINNKYQSQQKKYPERISQIDANIVGINSQLSNPTTPPELRLSLESQKRQLELQKNYLNSELSKSKESRDKSYDEMTALREKALNANNPAISREMVIYATRDYSIAQTNVMMRPNDPQAQIEFAKATEELARAQDFDRRTNSNVQVCPNAWSCIGGIMSAYNQYKGIGEFALLAWPEYGEWSNKWKQTITQSFCLFNGIQNCIESTVCAAILDTSSGNTIAGNVLFGRGPSGQILTAGTINAERSLPLVIKGVERDLLLDILGTDLIIVNNQIINISEVDTTTLPAQEIRLYRIQYSITNIHQDRDLSYNIEVKGQATRKVYPNDKKLNSGQTERKTIEEYKTADYDEICLTFNPSLPSGGSVVGQLTVQPKMVNQLCKPIAEYAGGATSIGNYAKEEKQNQPSGITGGTW